MMETSHHGALPIHRFWPLRIQLSPSRLAVVVRPSLVPEPTSGSVRPKQPFFSMRSIGGRPLCLCFFVPSCLFQHLAMSLCTPHDMSLSWSRQPSTVRRPCWVRFQWAFESLWAEALTPERLQVVSDV